MSVRISLSNNKGFASVSIEDAPRVRQYRWYLGANGYPTTNIHRNLVYLHHFIIGKPPEGKYTDHRNRCRCDARRSNLRHCTPAQNQMNVAGGSGRSEYKGVWQDQRDGRWYAEICANGKQHSLGAYAIPKEAARAYDAAARFYHGEFAATNFDGTEALDAQSLMRRNRAVVPGATSPYFGVRFDSRYKEPWLTRLYVGAQCVLRARFATAEEAAIAYDAKVRELGLMRHTNFDAREEP